MSTAPQIQQTWPEELQTSFEPGAVYNLDIEEYHADKSISSTGMIKGLTTSVERWLDYDFDGSWATWFGNVVHTRVLEPHRYTPTYLDPRPPHDLSSTYAETVALTLDGKTVEQVADAKGSRVKTIEGHLERDDVTEVIAHYRDHGTYDQPHMLDADDEQLVERMHDALRNHNAAANLLWHLDGDSEVSLFFRERLTGVPCRVRPDRLVRMPDGRLIYADLKTWRGGSIGDWKYQAAKHKYHIQAAFYADGIEHVFGERPAAVYWIAVSKEEQPTVECIEVGPQSLERGRQNENGTGYRQCLERVREWAQGGGWKRSGQPGQWVHTVEVPQWGDR